MLADAQQCFSNCRVYNERPDSAKIREMADEVVFLPSLPSNHNTLLPQGAGWRQSLPQGILISVSPACRQAEVVFLDTWQKAGLEGPKPSRPPKQQAKPTTAAEPTPSRSKLAEVGQKQEAGAASSEEEAEQPESPSALPPIDAATCRPEKEVSSRLSVPAGADTLF